MDTKLRLKQMSHKQLRKLVKRLGTELQDMAKLAEHRGDQWNKNRVLVNTLDKEKVELTQRLASAREANANLKQWNEDKDKRIADLEHALDALGYKPDGMPLNKAVDLGVAMANQQYIGQMPHELSMGVDGQLKTEEERYTAIEQSEIAEEAEHAAWVASEVARVKDGDIPLTNLSNIKVGDEIETPSGKFTVTGNLSQEAWAKRNGHHYPNGKPDKDRSTSVHIKSADEISADNAARHEEMKP